MQPPGKKIEFTLFMIIAVTATMLVFSTTMNASAADDAAKPIQQKLSKVKRDIVTAPSRAEQGWLEARDMLLQLEKSDPGHNQIPALQKTLEQLGQKLEKRLGRPAGESSPAAEKKEPAPKPETASAGLPGSVTSRLKKISADLNAAETSLSKNQLQTAVTKLNSAQKTMDEIQSRYGDKIPKGHPDLQAAVDRMAAVSQKVGDARSAADQAADAEAAAKAKKETQSQEWIDRFSPFRDYKSDAYLLMGSNFNSASQERQERCRQAYAEANALMAEYQKTEFPHGKTRELLSLESGLLDTLRYFNEGEAKEAQREACKEWVVKLQPYVSVGAGSDKYLIAGVTASEAQIKEQEALFREAQAVWSDYRKAAFPLGKTPGLVQLETEMQQRLEEMPEVLRKSRALLAGGLEGELDRILAYLNRDTGWKSDTSKTPNIAMQRDVDPLHEALARYAGTVAPDDPTLAVLKQKIARIEETDKAHRAIRAERIYMEPERYQGSDADELRQKVNDIVAEKSGEVLRITLRAQDWKEEDVLEWTDTTKTTVRYRITKFMTAQAAAKAGDGKVYLHSVHLASNRQSDGQWGPLYGHIMWSDWMAAANVNQ